MCALGWRYRHGFALIIGLSVASCGGDPVEQANPPRVSVIATTIPGMPEASLALAKEPPQPPQSYVVAAGDTLADIAGRFGVTPADIVRASKLTDANRLAIGQKLLIPPPTTTTTTAVGNGSSSNSTSSTSTGKASSTTAAVAQTYVVRQGDTLASIADRFEVSSSAIASASKLANPDLLTVGQQLTIPEPDRSAATTTIAR